MPGILYIVATPIGNLEDITFRAVRVLSEVNLIAAEDTRHTLNLLRYYNISKPLTSYFDHNQHIKGEFILDALRRGSSVALVTDAGTPCISDPGYNLVRDAVLEGIRVVPIPGASAVVAALSASGLATESFTFVGFPPSKRGKRLSFLKSFVAISGTLVLYEAPHRLFDTLIDLFELFGNREIVVAREITKLYEEFIRGTIEEVLSLLQNQKIRGEIAVLVEPLQHTETFEYSIEDELEKLFEKGCTCKDAVKQVSEKTGASRSIVYPVAIEIFKKCEQL